MLTVTPLEKPRAHTGTTTNRLGAFLRDRRARVSPSPDAPGRRRTPGLRREEVAARAGVSVTWYTWLEQGRGGPPSELVLEKLARALELDAAGREMLFLLAQHRPPPRRPAPLPKVSPALQRVLDSFGSTPAFVKTPEWDVVAWNVAATAVLADYAAVPPEQRNISRLFFDPTATEHLPDWEENARFIVAVLRMDLTRAGWSPRADALIAELQEKSELFRRLWAKNDVRSHGSGQKRFKREGTGIFTLEFSAFDVDGAEGLSMCVYAPVSAADRRAVETLVARVSGRLAPRAREGVAAGREAAVRHAAGRRSARAR